MPDPRARRHYLTASGIDHPDGSLFENYECDAGRNYTDYRSEEADRMINARMQEVWLDK